MSAVAVATRTSVRVNVQSRSIVFTANELHHLLMETVLAQGLPVDYLHRHLKLLIEGFATWMTGRWLKEIVLEVYDPPANQLVRCFELEIAYETQERAESFRTHMDKLKAQLARLKSLRPGCDYRVVVVTRDGAPDLPGWVKTHRMDTSHLMRREFGGVIDTAMIGVGMTYLGERTDS